MIATFCILFKEDIFTNQDILFFFSESIVFAVTFRCFISLEFGKPTLPASFVELKQLIPLLHYF